MAYQSLYRKYRPQTFSDVVGQGHVTRTLQNAIASGRIAHGYLFTGTRGTAKTTVARLLAKALNCESSDRPVAEPCNACAACRAITSGGSIDVIEMDAASHRGVADIEEVRKSVGYGPMELRYKVFIIDEAHQLSSDAKDAFLKTLEEPPANVVFILATTEPQSIPITIRSRCQQFDFKRGSLLDIASRLSYVLTQEGVDFTPDAVNMVARGAEGSYRDSLSLLEQVLAFSPERITAGDVHTVLGTLDSEALLQITEAVTRKDASTLFALAGEMLDAGKEARTILRALTSHFRDLLLVTVGGPAVAAELTPDETPALQAQARAFTPGQILAAMDVLNEAQAETRWNNQQRFLIERTFLKLLVSRAGNPGNSDSAPGLQITTAPIVFPTPPVTSARPQAVAQTMVPSSPPASQSPSPVAPTATLGANKLAVPAPLDSTPVPPAPEQVVAEEAEIPASYFASDEDGEEDGIDPSDLMGDDTEDTEDTQPAPSEPEPALPLEDSLPFEEIADTGALTDLEQDDPGLFDEDTDASGEDGITPVPPEPLLPSSSGAQKARPEEPETLIAATTTPTPTRPASEPEPNLFTLDMAIQIWPYFMSDAARISKKTQMMMAQALPTLAEGATLEVMFNNRAAHDMMSEPKGMEFVRKLLMRRLNVEKLTLRFTLSESVAPLVRQEKKKVTRDRFEDLDRLDAPADEFGSGGGYPSALGSIPPPAHNSVAAARPQFAVSSARPAYTPSTGESPFRREDAGMRHNNQGSGNVSSWEEPSPEVPSHPLLEDVLSIFGGTIVKD